MNINRKTVIILILVIMLISSTMIFLIERYLESRIDIEINKIDDNKIDKNEWEIDNIFKKKQFIRLLSLLRYIILVICNGSIIYIIIKQFYKSRKDMKKL